MNLFDYAEAKRRGDVAIDTVRKNAHDDFVDAFRVALDAVLSCCAEFTTDHIWRELESHNVTCREPRVVGALLRQAAADGLVAATNRYTPTARVAAHGRPIRVWRNLTGGGRS